MAHVHAAGNRTCGIWMHASKRCFIETRCCRCNIPSFVKTECQHTTRTWIATGNRRYHSQTGSPFSGHGHMVRSCRHLRPEIRALCSNLCFSGSHRLRIFSCPIFLSLRIPFDKPNRWPLKTTEDTLRPRIPAISALLLER